MKKQILVLVAVFLSSIAAYSDYSGNIYNVSNFGIDFQCGYYDCCAWKGIVPYSYYSGNKLVLDSPGYPFVCGLPNHVEYSVDSLACEYFRYSKFSEFDLHLITTMIMHWIPPEDAGGNNWGTLSGCQSSCIAYNWPDNNDAIFFNQPGKKFIANLSNQSWTIDFHDIEDYVFFPWLCNNIQNYFNDSFNNPISTSEYYNNSTQTFTLQPYSFIIVNYSKMPGSVIIKLTSSDNKSYSLRLSPDVNGKASIDYNQPDTVQGPFLFNGDQQVPGGAKGQYPGSMLIISPMGSTNSNRTTY